MIRRNPILSEYEPTLELTISEMKRLIDLYSSDVQQYQLRDLDEIFNFVKNIPYVKDADQSDGNYAEELLQRPIFTIENGGDCDDKVILIGAFLKNAGYHFRIVTVAYDPLTRVHVHTYVEVMIDGQWLPVDATYSRNELFYEHPYIDKKVW